MINSRLDLALSSMQVSQMSVVFFGSFQAFRQPSAIRFQLPECEAGDVGLGDAWLRDEEATTFLASAPAVVKPIGIAHSKSKIK